MPFLYEFLYRGNADGSNAFHVILGAQATDPFTQQPVTQYTDAMTPDQAQQQFGIGIPAIVANINAALIVENQNLTAALAALDNISAEQATPGFVSKMLALLGIGKT